MFNHIEFANIEFLVLLVLIPIAAIWYWYKHRRDYASIQISGIHGIEDLRTYKHYLFFVLYFMRLIALSLIIIALARPQSSTKFQDVSIEGIDIVTALDVSGSMLAMDLKPDRLEAAKAVALNFIEGRPDDRIGLVVFSGETFTQCPLTTDHTVLRNLFADIKSGMIEDGTAIGDGLATSVNRLKDSKAVSKVIILLTDGVNNKGSLDPLSAAEIAQVYGIRIYTIGVGTEGQAPYPFQTPLGIQTQYVDVEIDEALLQEVAEMTDGRYFRATSNQKLKEIYAEIDQLEKSKIDVTEINRKHEEFFLWALFALILISIEFLIRKLILKNTP